MLCFLRAESKQVILSKFSAILSAHELAKNYTSVNYDGFHCAFRFCLNNVSIISAVLTDLMQDSLRKVMCCLAFIPATVSILHPF